MTKTEHLQFLVLMIPTLLILVAAAVSMADLALPAQQETYVVAGPVVPGDAVWDDRPAQ
jgi:hypothetical protein